MNKLVLGSAQFGLNYGINNRRGMVPEKEVFRILEFASKNKIDQIDTASSYGTAESIIGRYLQSEKKAFGIITKASGSTESEIEHQISCSLKSLKLKQIYGVFLHHFADYQKNKKIYRKLLSYKKRKIITKIGFSLYFPKELEEILSDNVPVDIIQVPYSIFDQRFAYLFPELKKRNINIYVRSVFLQGLFFKKPESLKNSYFHRVENKISKIHKIAKQNEISVSSLCLNFVCSNRHVDKIVIGVDSLSNLKENLTDLKQEAKVMKVYKDLTLLKEDNEKIILPYNWPKFKTAKIVCIIQAHEKSTRLPKKVLLKIQGKTILEHCVSRVSQSKFIDQVVVATGSQKENRSLIKLCQDKEIEFFSGSEKDVLDRYYQTAKKYEAYHVVRITSDCPLIDAEIVDKVLKKHLDAGSDYTTNTLVETFPDGEDVEVMKFSALEKAWKNAGLESEREHVTPYIRKNPKLFQLVNVKNKIDYSGKRWTVDEKNDYIFVKKIFDALYMRNNSFSMIDILSHIKKFPEIENLNNSIERNSGYKKSIANDKIVKQQAYEN